MEGGGGLAADGLLGVHYIWWLLRCSHLVVLLCIALCSVGARLTTVCGAAPFPVASTPPPGGAELFGVALLVGCTTQASCIACYTTGVQCFIFCVTCSRCLRPLAARGNAVLWVTGECGSQYSPLQHEIRRGKGAFPVLQVYRTTRVISCGHW